MWVRKILVILLLALFAFSIFGTVSARMLPLSNAPLPPRTNDDDPWGRVGNTGENSGPTGSGIKSVKTQINSCSLISIGNIGNIPVVVFKVEVKKPNAF